MIEGLFNYWIAIFLMMAGFYVVIARNNFVVKLIGLSIFQTSVFFLFISMGRLQNGSAPILKEGVEVYKSGVAENVIVYSNPLPHVLILTAIVVGVATTALGLALVVRIREAFGTIEADEILKKEEEM